MATPPRLKPFALSMRLYTALLVLLPSEFRHEYGSQMIRPFADRRREAIGAGLRVNRLGLLVEAVWDLLITALVEHSKRFVDDLRFAWRGLVRAPAFASIVVFTLALGIGASTAVYSMVEAVLLTSTRY